MNNLNCQELSDFDITVLFFEYIINKKKEQCIAMTYLFLNQLICYKNFQNSRKDL